MTGRGVASRQSTAMTATQVRGEADVGQGENGLRVWSLKELYSESGSEDGTVPFKESVMGVSALMCLVGDEGSGSGLVWSRHTGGRVRPITTRFFPFAFLLMVERVDYGRNWETGVGYWRGDSNE
ncbi:hypothetical protein Q3G72_011072 [Acer saccharum]|nr:hypothetical protein Q3G72_011072 [Acer saccharum]